ncbi:MAG: enoyl-CoA hydratase-related protein [Tranquillimonas sp.]
MDSLVTRTAEGGVRTLVLSAPPGNALLPPVRAALLRALEEVAADPDAQAVVLSANGRHFSAESGPGGAASAAPDLAEICMAIEEFRLPVVAALHGLVVGGGLELALAAHGRVAHLGTRAAFPGIRYGLPPEAGASQRLPRLVGAARSLDLLLTGRVLDAAEGLEAGLWDRITDEGPALVAADLAMDLARKPLRPALSRDEGLADPAGFLSQVAAERRRLGTPPPAGAEAVIASVEGALILPPEAGLEMERSLRDEAEAAPAARGLQHAARAERAAWRAAEPVSPQLIRRIAIVGAEGVGLAEACLARDFEVDLVELDQDRLDAALLSLADRLDAEVAAGRLEPGERDSRLGRLLASAEFEDLAAADIVIEMGEPQPDVRPDLLRALGLAAQPGAIIAVVSALDPVAGLGAATGRPADTLAIDLPSPGHGWSRLAGLAAGPDTRSDALAAVARLSRRLGYQAALSRHAAGQGAAVLRAAMGRAVERLLLAGTGPVEIDAALLECGWTAGPCLMLDRLGLGAATDEMQLVEARAWGPGPLGILGALAETGAVGASAGRGLYAWERGAPTGPSREISAILAGGGQGAPEAAEVVRRVETALVAAAARLVASGAMGAAEADVAAVAGLGYPRARGGPLMGAELDGFVTVQKRLRGLAPDDGELWAPSPYLADLIKNGRRVSAEPGLA